MQGGILALDQATQTGLAYCTPGAKPAPSWLEANAGVKGEKHYSATHTLARKGTDPVDKVIGMHQLVQDHIDIHKPKFIMMEEIFTAGNQSSQATALITFGIAMKIEELAKRNGIRVFDVPIGTWRSHFIGAGHGKKPNLKRIVQRRCDALGWTYRDDNESDALGILDYAIWFFTDRGMMPQQPDGSNMSPADNLSKIDF